MTKKKRKLSGTQLALFQEFWEAFDYKRGKAEAADAWLDLKPFNSELVGAIMEGARREAEARPQMVAAGRTPKMAQGWLTARRWEDEPELFTRIGRQPPLSFKEQARLREEQQRRDTIRFNYEQGCEFCGEEL